ncbi:hypothetical protein MMC30_000082 [Trapelia coarctata]|nr:hypothetical protein [Trapelia coarctata]
MEDRSETSPYITPAFTLSIGPRRLQYTVLQGFLSECPEWAYICKSKHWSRTIELPDVYEETGHTLVHYLYTGTYQTLKLQNSTESTTELKRNIRIYCVAKKYKLAGLETLAKSTIESFEGEVSISEFLDIAKEAYQALPYDDIWFGFYLKKMINTVFKAAENWFGKSHFLEHIGEVKNFDRSLVKIIVELYTENIRSTAGKAEDPFKESPCQAIRMPICSKSACFDGPPCEECVREQPVVCKKHVYGDILCGEAIPCDEPILCDEPVPCDEPALCDEPVACASKNTEYPGFGSSVGGWGRWGDGGGITTNTKSNWGFRGADTTNTDATETTKGSNDIKTSNTANDLDSNTWSFEGNKKTKKKTATSGFDFGDFTKDATKEEDPPKDEPKENDTCGTFASMDKKDKKKGKKGAIEEVKEPDPPATVVVGEDDSWGIWGAKKDKKVVSIAPSLPAPSEPLEDERYFSNSKSKKRGKKGAIEEVKEPDPPATVAVGEDDPWGIWGAKKDKKVVSIAPSLPAPSEPLEDERYFSNSTSKKKGKKGKKVKKCSAEEPAEEPAVVFLPEPEPEHTWEAATIKKGKRDKKDVVEGPAVVVVPDPEPEFEPVPELEGEEKAACEEPVAYEELVSGFVVQAKTKLERTLETESVLEPDIVENSLCAFRAKHLLYGDLWKSCMKCRAVIDQISLQLARDRSVDEGGYEIIERNLTDQSIEGL